MADFAIRRTSGEGWTYVSAEPKSSFKEYSEEVFAGDGSRVELGYIDVLWDYGDLPLTGLEMEEFYRFCPGATASVQVRTKTREVDSNGQPVFRAYDAIMYRPDSEFDTQHSSQRFVQVKIQFKCSTEITS